MCGVPSTKVQSPRKLVFSPLVPKARNLLEKYCFDGTEHTKHQSEKSSKACRKLAFLPLVPKARNSLEKYHFNGTRPRLKSILNFPLCIHYSCFSLQRHHHFALYHIQLNISKKIKLTITRQVTPTKITFILLDK